jgi:hypothetical protein
MLLPRRIQILLLMAAAAFLYHWAGRLGAHAFTGLRPDWWLPSYAGAWTTYSWLQLAHTGGLLLASLPFAVAIALLRPVHPVRIALAIAVIGLLAPALYWHAITPDWLRPTGIGLASAIVDYAKFVAALPLLTWLASRALPSNNSSKPTPLRGAA